MSDAVLGIPLIDQTDDEELEIEEGDDMYNYLSVSYKKDSTRQFHGTRMWRATELAISICLSGIFIYIKMTC